MVRFLRFNIRTSSRILNGGSVHYKQLTSWSWVEFGRPDMRTRKRPFSEAVVAGEGLAPNLTTPPPKCDIRLAVVY